MNLIEKLVGVVRVVAGRIRADEDTPKTESVPFKLEIDFSECTVEDVLSFACADRKIAWAASGRKTIGTIKPGQVIKIKASSPGTRPQLTAEEMLQAEAEAKGVTLVELLQAKIAAMTKK